MGFPRARRAVGAGRRRRLLSDDEKREAVVRAISWSTAPAWVLRDPYTAKPYVLFYTTKRVGGGVQIRCD